MEANLSIHDLSMEDLEQLQNHPYLAEYSDVQSKIEKEINDRKQGLSFCPADHTIFVYHGFHRVENVETTKTVTLRTTEGKPYQLTLDVLSVRDRQFYTTCSGRLPPNDYLVARLLPIEILTSEYNNEWMYKLDDYGIYCPSDRRERRKKFLQSLLTYRIYSKDEIVDFLFSLIEEIPVDSYTLSCVSEDKKFVSSLPEPIIDDLFQELDEVKEAKQAVAETAKVQQQEKLPEVSSSPETTKNIQTDTKKATEAFDFAVDKNGTFDYSPSKHTMK